MKIHKPHLLRGAQRWHLPHCPSCGRAVPWGRHIVTAGSGFGVVCDGCALRLHYDSMSRVIKVHKS